VAAAPAAGAIDFDCHPEEPAERGEGPLPSFLKAYYVYLMTNASRVVLYTGVTERS